MSLRVAVLVSGRGSNLQALIDDMGRGGYELAVVASDRPRCRAIARAQAAGIATLAQRPGDHPDRASFDRALFGRLAGHRPDLIVLAGFMRILDAEVVRGWPGPMINIHPSLLPRHAGLDTHARALAGGDAEHGASVHQVIAELDAGPVLAQARVPVRPDDDAASLAARLLPLEHRLLVACVRLFAQGRLALTPAGIQFDGRRLARPMQLDADHALSPGP